MPWDDAVARIAEMPVVTRDVMDGLLPELKAYAFSVSGIDHFDQLQRIKNQIQRVPAGEVAWGKAKAQIRDELTTVLGKKDATRRAELLLRTHAFRAFAVARYRVLMSQLKAFPYWQYKTMGDGRVRPAHAELNGRILPAGHPLWQRIFPPWDWGCRCMVIPRSRREVEELAAEEQGMVPEDSFVWGPDVADAILASERLPGLTGVAIRPSETWSTSPWSVPGNVRHTWGEIQDRYDADTLAAFGQWAEQTEISEGLTVSGWLGGAKAGKALTKRPAAVPAAPPVVTPAVAVQGAQAAGTPLAGKLTDEALPKAEKKRVERVLAMIDQVHGDGPLSAIPVDHKVSKGSLGTFFSRAGTPMRIAYRRRKMPKLPNLQLHPEMTLLHEIGHWLDLAGLPGRGFSSGSTALLPWLDAVRGTAAFQRMMQSSNVRNLRYYASNEELWARSYAQYIAEETQDAELLSQLADTRTSAYFPEWSQWESADFAPVRSAITDLLTAQGWRKS